MTTSNLVFQSILTPTSPTLQHFHVTCSDVEEQSHFVTQLKDEASNKNVSWLPIFIFTELLSFIFL